MLATRGHLDEARELYEAALGHAQAVGDIRSVAITLGNLGVLLGEMNLLEEAKAANERARTIHREVGNRQFEGIALADLAYIEGRLGDFESARRHFDEAMAINLAVGNRRNVAAVHGYRGQVERAAGNPGAAADLADRAIAILDELGETVYRSIFQCDRGLAAVDLGEDATAYLEAAEQAMAEVGATDTSELARAVAALRAAIAAAANRGTAVDDE